MIILVLLHTATSFNLPPLANTRCLQRSGQERLHHRPRAAALPAATTVTEVTPLLLASEEWRQYVFFGVVLAVLADVVSGLVTGQSVANALSATVRKALDGNDAAAGPEAERPAPTQTEKPQGLASLTRSRTERASDMAAEAMGGNSKKSGAVYYRIRGRWWRIHVWKAVHHKYVS